MGADALGRAAAAPIPGMPGWGDGQMSTRKHRAGKGSASPSSGLNIGRGISPKRRREDNARDPGPDWSHAISEALQLGWDSSRLRACVQTLDVRGR